MNLAATRPHPVFTASCMHACMIFPFFLLGCCVGKNRFIDRPLGWPSVPVEDTPRRDISRYMEAGVVRGSGGEKILFPWLFYCETLSTSPKVEAVGDGICCMTVLTEKPRFTEVI